IVRGYLVSATMVGRQRELALIRSRLRRAVSGWGRSAFVRAASGMGKSRLLKEVGFEAQLLGAVVARADSDEAAKGPYGVLRALVRQRLALLPAETRETAAPHAAIMARVLPELLSLGLCESAAPSLSDPTEERLRLQDELTTWLLELSGRRPFV